MAAGASHGQPVGDAAQVIVDETFRIPAVQHVAMEPHACIAGWRDGRLEVESAPGRGTRVKVVVP